MFVAVQQFLDQVERVESGERYTLSAWFTYGAGSKDVIPTDQN